MFNFNNTAILFEDESTEIPDGLDQRHLKRIHLMQQLFVATFPYSQPTGNSNLTNHPEPIRNPQPPLHSKLRENGTTEAVEETPKSVSAHDDSIDTNTNPTNNTIQTIIANLKTIDQAIQSAAPERPISGINRVDLAILRLIIFEATHSKTPKKVLINEAVVLAKNFGSETSAKFVDGVLGTVLITKPLEQVPEEPTTETPTT